MHVQLKITKMRLAFYILLISVSGVAFGQDSTFHNSLARNVFKFAPQNFSVNTLKIGFERFHITGKHSLTLYLSGRFDGNSSNSLPNTYEPWNYKGLGSELQYRKYLKKFQHYTSKKGRNFNQGIYLSGYLQGGRYLNKGDYIYTQYDRNSGQVTYTELFIDESIWNWGTGFTMGFQRTFMDIIYLDVYIGGGIQWSEIDFIYSPTIQTIQPLNEYQDIYMPGYEGIMPKIGIQIGIAL